jgi:probable F420-dependent oxidoreductase
MTRGRKRWNWGVLFSGDKLSMDELLRYTAMAEGAGAESVWAAELWRDAFVPLTAMATVAKKMRVGTAVAHFARPPLLTELSAMSLAECTQGRFILGLGTAPPEWNENCHGLPYRKTVTRMREYVECIRAMWTATPTHAVSYNGECYQIKDYRRLMPAPYERVPIYLAGVLPRMIQLAGSHADGLLVNVLNTPRYFSEVIFPNLKHGWAVTGRSRQGFEICMTKLCTVSSGAKQARTLARRGVAFYATIPYFDIVFDPLGFTEAKLQIRAAMQRQDIPGMLDAVTEEMIDALALAGTPEDIHRQLEPFEELCDTLLLACPSFATDPEEVRANHAALIAAFAP